ncbi:MAG TPA: GNAT family N-acetyltransferase [Acidimicrobiales bacterium]|nr:GNAT family N-acetyltransferase [Acidimicrobiales bacterium]
MSGVEVRELRADEHAAWDRFVDEAGGRAWQTTWWAAPLVPFGVDFCVLARWDGGQITGGALVRLTRVPKIPITMAEVIRGPVGADWSDADLGLLVDAIDVVARRARSLRVTFQAVPDPQVHAALERILRARRGAVSRHDAPSDAIIPLTGRTVDEVVAAFHKSPRRDLRVANASTVEVRELATGPELELAYGCFAASSGRQGYLELRPAAALLPMMAHAAATGDGVTLGAFDGDDILAAVFVTLVGAEAEYLYGGFRSETIDGAKVYPNLALQQEGLRRSIAKGLDGYCLGLVGGTTKSKGVDAFKVRLGAEVIPLAERLVWTVHPRTASLFDAVRRSSWGKQVVGRVRAAVTARGQRRADA